MSGYPGATWEPSPNFTSGRASALTHIVLHTTEDTSAQGSLNTLTDPVRQLANSAGVLEDAQVSSHYVVAEGGVYQLVADENTAWHARGNNANTIGIEVVGRADSPGTWTPAKVQRLGELVGWLASEYGIPLEYREDATAPAAPRGIVSHGALDPLRRHDPGVWFPWSDVRAIAAGDASASSGPGASAAGAPQWGAVVGVLIVALGLAWALKP